MHIKESLRAVLNTSSVIILIKLGILDKLPSLFNEIEIPKGVLNELGVRRVKIYQELNRAIDEGRIHVEDVKIRLPKLGLGESSAIFLALTKGKIIVLDDKRARKLARELGLEVIGTISILRYYYA